MLCIFRVSDYSNTDLTFSKRKAYRHLVWANAFGLYILLPVPALNSLPFCLLGASASIPEPLALLFQIGKCTPH